jgi:malonyl-CoA/methylmalonyl-CoA synthetase
MVSNHLFDQLLASRLEEKSPFLRFEDEESWSYKKTLNLSARLSNCLVKLSVHAGDRVAVQVDKSPHAIALYIACIRCGAVFLPLNTAYTSKEIEYLLTDAQPSLLICDPRQTQAFSVIADRHKIMLSSLDSQGVGELMCLAKGESTSFQTIAREPDDLAALLYTSGTTGRPKGAMLSHNNLLSNAIALAKIWHFNRQDVLLHALPIFHTHGLFVATNVTLAVGCSMYLLTKFDAEQLIRLMPNSSVMMGVPTHYTRLLSEQNLTKKVTENMRVFISGSAPLLNETHEAFECRTGHNILERYGMTETNMNTSNPIKGERRVGTVGKALPQIEVRITNTDTGDKQNAGEVGMIEVRGPNVFIGYWQMPEKTAEEFRHDGFFITGDLGRIDEAGYLCIDGRAKDLIISGGLNVYPKEVEVIMDLIEGVEESAVYGVSHPDFGEAVVATVVREDRGCLSEDDIKEALKPQLARFKQPKCIFFADSLPRNAMGKVQKNKLRDQHSSLFQAP